MTVKEFFKSTAFKCIAVLMSVLLVSGVLLAIAWGFLEVTDEERFARKIAVMYNGEQVTSEQKDLSGYTTKVGDATIQSMWYISDKNDYLVQAASRGLGGDITCWITVNMEGETTVKGIGKVIVYSVADPGEFVGNIPDSVYEKFRTEYTDGKQFTYGTKGEDGYIDVGASYSLTAVCNNVNGAVAFVKAYAGGGKIENPYEGFAHTDLINTTSETLKPTWKINGEEVEYTITTKSNGGPVSFGFVITVDASKTVKSCEMTKNGCTSDYYYENMHENAKNLVGKSLADIESYLTDDDDGGNLKTGATKSNELCYEAAAFALANYDLVIASAQGGN
ncbi:MAG: hypothetical protein K2O67_00160 [Clostridia bacterium]|nr:hypothetical protein [Clostridia bacterium]